MNNPRIEELKHHSEDISWLNAVEASRASKSHYGLNAQTVGSVERLEFEEDVSTATDWLRSRISGFQERVVVFGGNDRFRCSGNFFVENWSDIFVPSRNDAMVYSPESSFILFYCHENEFEAGNELCSTETGQEPTLAF